jgi:hypothetical protein
MLQNPDHPQDRLGTTALKSLALPGISGLSLYCARWNGPGNLFRLKSSAIVGELPGSHVTRLAGGHTYDHVAIPGPGMLAIVFAGLGRMIWMGMIPANQVQSLLFGSALGGAKIVGGNGKAIPRGIVAPIREGEKRAHLTPFLAVNAKHGAAGLVGIILRAVAADALSDV